MSLIVETGFGAANAESYVSAAELETMLDEMGATTALSGWRSKSTPEKEAILRQATRYIERAYGTRYVGVRAVNDQALGWPRFGATDRDGRLIDSDEIPQALKRATQEAAKRIVSGTSLLADLDAVGAVKVERVKAGSTEVETEYATGSATTGTAQAQKYPEIELEIRPLLRAGSRIRRA